MSRSDGTDMKEIQDLRNIMENMNNEMLECSFETFQSHYMPFVPANEAINICVEALKVAHILEKRNDDTLYWNMLKDSLSNSEYNEIKTSQALSDIANTITRQMLPGTPSSVPSSKYSHCPKSRISSEITGEKFLLDGCFLLQQDVEGITPSNIAVFSEYNMQNEQENRFQLLSTANNIMNDDPRRMFIFGITIDHDELSLWYFSRSHSSKSRAISFTKDYRQLISVLISIIFATEKQLGFDPTVHRIYSKPIQYVYELQVGSVTRYFKTVKMLYGHRSLCITNRATRVYKAIEVTDATGREEKGPHTVALKDVWLNVDARTEKSIQDEIFGKVEALRMKHKDKDIGLLAEFKQEQKLEDTHYETIHECIRKGTYKDYFVTIECDWLGATSKTVAPGSNQRTDLFCIESDIDIIPDVQEYQPKRQYRLVFLDVCTSLYYSPDITTSGRVLYDAGIALVILWLVNWVHRDISPGNILYTGSNKDNNIQGKLGDLEFAMDFALNPPTGSVGTPFFMATNVLTGSPYYDAPKTLRAFVGASPRDPPRPPVSRIREERKVVYNFQYDVESMWWIVLWIITSHINHTPSRNYSKNIFKTELSGPNDNRLLIFKLDDYLVYFGQQYCHELVARRFIPEIMDQVRVILRGAYYQRARDRNVLKQEAYAFIEDVMMKFMGCVHKFFVDLDNSEGWPGLVNIHDSGNLNAEEIPSTINTSSAVPDDEDTSTDVGINQAAIATTILYKRNHSSSGDDDYSGEQPVTQADC